MEAARGTSEHEREVFLAELEQLHRQADDLRGERETLLRLIESLTRERAEVTATRDQIKAAFSSGEKLYQAKIAQVSQALQQATQEGDALRRRGDELAGQVRELRDELDRQQRDREAEHRQSTELLAALRQDAGAPRPRAARPGEDGDRPRRQADGLRGERETLLRLIESLTQERAEVTATRDQIKAAFSSGEKLYQAKIAQVSQALQQATQEGDVLRRRGDELAGQVRELRDELERQRARGGARPRRRGDAAPGTPRPRASPRRGAQPAPARRGHARGPSPGRRGGRGGRHGAPRHRPERDRGPLREAEIGPRRAAGRPRPARSRRRVGGSGRRRPGHHGTHRHPACVAGCHSFVSAGRRPLPLEGDQMIHPNSPSGKSPTGFGFLERPGRPPRRVPGPARGSPSHPPAGGRPAYRRAPGAAPRGEQRRQTSPAAVRTVPRRIVTHLLLEGGREGPRGSIQTRPMWNGPAGAHRPSSDLQPSPPVRQRTVQGDDCPFDRGGALVSRWRRRGAGGPVESMNHQAREVV